VETLVKEKKEKDNVLTYFELVNLKNVYLLDFEELRINWWKKRRTIKGIYNNCKYNWRLHGSIEIV
jgi:hypothetical protein